MHTLLKNAWFLMAVLLSGGCCWCGGAKSAPMFQPMLVGHCPCKKVPEGWSWNFLPSQFAMMLPSGEVWTYDYINDEPWADLVEKMKESSCILDRPLEVRFAESSIGEAGFLAERLTASSIRFRAWLLARDEFPSNRGGRRLLCVREKGEDRGEVSYAAFVVYDGEKNALIEKPEDIRAAADAFGLHRGDRIALCFEHAMEENKKQEIKGSFEDAGFDVECGRRLEDPKRWISSGKTRAQVSR